MKIIRTKNPIIIGDRIKRQSVVAVAITKFEWDEQIKRYQAKVVDFEVKPVESPMPGSPINIYLEINKKTITKTTKEINDLFDFLNKQILIGDVYTEKNRELIVQGLLIDTQQKPIYGTAPEDWEIIDTDEEIFTTN